MLSLVKSAKFSVGSNAVAAGTTTINGASVDMSGFDAAVFIAQFGAIVSTAVTSVKVQGSTDNSTFVDLADTGYTVADTDDNKAVVVEVLQPTYRYLRCVVLRATANATLEALLNIQHTPRFLPVTQDTTILGSEVNVSPASGTP